MAKKGRPRKQSGRSRGPGAGAPGGGAGKPPKKPRRPAKGGARKGAPAAANAYFLQPGKGGSVIVLRRPSGNRISPKVCGIMPSKVAAGMLVDQLMKAESVVKDLFLEATDDGIEALEAVLEACVEEVLRKAGGEVKDEGMRE